MNAKGLMSAILLVLCWIVPGSIASAQPSVKFDTGYPAPGNCKVTGVGTVTFDKNKYKLNKVTLYATPTGGGQGGEAVCTINAMVDPPSFNGVVEPLPAGTFSIFARAHMTNTDTNKIEYWDSKHESKTVECKTGLLRIEPHFPVAKIVLETFDYERIEEKDRFFPTYLVRIKGRLHTNRKHLAPIQDASYVWAHTDSEKSKVNHDGLRFETKFLMRDVMEKPFFEQRTIALEIPMRDHKAKKDYWISERFMLSELMERYYPTILEPPTQEKK